MRPRSVLFAPLVALLLAVPACGSDAPAAATAFDRLVAAATPGMWRGTGPETVEVFVCRVPATTVSPVYAGQPLRIPMSPATLAALFQQQVARYYDRISHGAYAPRFVAGSDVELQNADGPAQCADRAIAAASPDADVVLAVADAEHAPDEHGGLGSAGEPVVADATVGTSRRYAYVGASDFDRSLWADDPPMDLVEHELGHTLGWQHSGIGADDEYLSGLDVMSNSAAPRDVDPTRRDAPDTIAVQRVVAGWIPTAEVQQVTAAATIPLTPSTGKAVRKLTRLAVLPVDQHTFLTVELIAADGLDAHLPADGVAVHRVRIGGDGLPTTIDPLVGSAPFTTLLAEGDTFTSAGWTLRVNAGWTVDARPLGA